MGKIKLFDLIEKSFVALRKTNKKIWIIGMIIAVFSGGLLLEDSLDYNLYSDSAYENEMLLNEGDYNENGEFSDTFLVNPLSYIIAVALIAILIFAVIVFIISMLTSVISYYLFNSSYETLFDTKLDRASLGLVVKVNAIVALKVLVGLILFIIPGIIVGIKYAPANYILCKHPELSSKEILQKTRELSKGFKWKMFIYSSFITIVSSILLSVCLPNVFISGNTFIDILSILIKFALTTFIAVYTVLFNIYLYQAMEESKNKILI